MSIKAVESLQKKPGLIVFDLDYTLWGFGIDLVKPPFSIEGHKITDSVGKVVNHYPDVPEILQFLQDEGIPVAAASRVHNFEAANQLLDALGWNKFFTYKQIYPGCKSNHFKMFAKESGLPYTSMIFFDDEDRNVRDISSIGVHCVWVKGGVNMKIVKDAMKKFPLKFCHEWD